jgi:membrane protease YdiL (CAAX protease family)
VSTSPGGHDPFAIGAPGPPQPSAQWSPQQWPPPPAWNEPLPKRRRGVPAYDEAQPYHRILHTRNYRWWRPLVGLAVTAVTFIVISLVVTTAALLPAFLSGSITIGGGESDLEAALISDPLGLLGVNLSLAAFIPAVILGLLAGHQLRPGWLHSVVGRMRWSFLFWCLLIEVGVTAVILPLSAIVGGDVTGSATPTDPLTFAAWLPFAVVILLTTPLQAAGEEYGFRGYGIQALGAWVRNPWFAIVITSLLFAAAHGGQNLALFLNRFAFGMIAGWLTVRTGGLEAAIGIHVVNNLVVLLIASAAGQLAPSLTPSAAPWGATVLDVVGMLLYAVLALRLAKRKGLDRMTAVSPPPVPAPPLPAPVPAPGQAPLPGWTPGWTSGGHGFGEPPSPR